MCSFAKSSEKCTITKLHTKLDVYPQLPKKAEIKKIRNLPYNFLGHPVDVYALSNSVSFGIDSTLLEMMLFASWRPSFVRLSDANRLQYAIAVGLTELGIL